jgi:dsDNA-specific endonuclease/ATPase MutS2
MQSLIENLVKGNINKFRSSIHENLYEKLKVALEEKRKEVAQNLYNIKEGKMPPQLKKALEAKKKGKKSSGKKGSKGKKPDFLDLDKDGDKKEPMKEAAKEAKGKK